MTLSLRNVAVCFKVSSQPNNQLNLTKVLKKYFNTDVFFETRALLLSKKGAVKAEYVKCGTCLRVFRYHKVVDLVHWRVAEWHAVAIPIDVARRVALDAARQASVVRGNGQSSRRRRQPLDETRSSWIVKVRSLKATESRHKRAKVTLTKHFDLNLGRLAFACLVHRCARVIGLIVERHLTHVPVRFSDLGYHVTVPRPPELRGCWLAKIRHAAVQQQRPVFHCHFRLVRQTRVSWRIC